MCRWPGVLRHADWNIRVEMLTAGWRKSGDVKSGRIWSRTAVRNEAEGV